MIQYLVKFKRTILMNLWVTPTVFSTPVLNLYTLVSIEADRKLTKRIMERANEQTI